MTKVTASSKKVNIYILGTSALSILSLEIGEQQYNDSVLNGTMSTVEPPNIAQPQILHSYCKPKCAPVNYLFSLFQVD